MYYSTNVPVVPRDSFICENSSSWACSNSSHHYKNVLIITFEIIAFVDR